MRRTLFLLTVGIVATVLWTAEVKAADDQEVRRLRADRSLFKATLERREKQIADLKEEIKGLKEEIERLKKGATHAEKPSSPAAPASDTKSIESPVTLKVGNGELRVRFQFTTLYVPAGPPMKGRLGYSGFFFVTYQEAGGTVHKKPVAGHFRVNGNPEKLTVRSSNKKVLAGYGRLPTAQELLAGKKLLPSPPLSRDLNYTDDYGLTLTAVRPGTANIVVSLANRSVSIPIKVTEVPINGGGVLTRTRTGKPAHTKDEVIKILGLPDKREERYLAWPKSAWVDGIFYSASDPRYGVSVEHWKYRKYPGMVISFQGEHVNQVRTVQKFETAD